MAFTGTLPVTNELYAMHIPLEIDETTRQAFQRIQVIIAQLTAAVEDGASAVANPHEMHIDMMPMTTGLSF